MKIGILTFHYMINQGSVLQAYCVYKLLKIRFPTAAIEIINLVPKNRGKREKNFFKKKPPFIRWKFLAKYKSMREFLKSRVPFSPFCDSIDLDEQIKFINAQNYNIVFSGSDTVWMDSEKLNHILPHIYFLPRGIYAKKNTIAASLDPLKSRERYFQARSELDLILKGIDNILVRDKITYDIIKELGDYPIQQIADPTILYPFEKELKLNINKKGKIGRERVHVSFGDKKMKHKIQSLLLDTGLFEIVEFRERSHFFKGDHILDYLNEYANVEFLITDRFHRSIFALKLSSALIINVEHYLKNPLRNSKGRDLFNKIGMPEYCVRYDQGKEDKLVSSIVSLVNAWNKEKLEKRENQFASFILENQNIWKSLNF
jgi:polysaccharide pyruvyl transferase WcaK-like protein